MKPKPDWTILVISADSVVSTRIDEVLSDERTRVVRVDSVKNFFVELQQREPHLIVYDPEIPSLSGLEAFAIAKHYHPALPAIFLYEEEDFEAAREIMAKGVLYRMPKPLNEEALQQIFANVRMSSMRKPENH